ncbi:MAG: ImmA/IrrE family metallo-endopeptidase [Nocardiopsaceae bacterium]|jgi:Zn-dependent peptidase ImmA (M78 family)/transcriptional regulator with XRE-family HTH domain|nr:ImmA/IrrE family metallo-endopeptidase [Nocardiopsaceae bacterium]
MTETELGARIAALREARGIKGAELGAALGLSRSQISKIEHGTRRLDVSEVAAIADALDISLAEVLGVERSGSLALAARVMAAPDAEDTLPSRRRMRQLLEAEATLAISTGLPSSRLTPSGHSVLAMIGDRAIPSSRTPWREGEDLARIAREGLGLGRAPIADVAELTEQHFGLDVLAWPTGTGVSGLCAHGQGVAMALISTSFPRGHQRFTAAHELAHHLLRDPREIVIDTGLYENGNPAEQRANAFAAALLMPADGLRDVTADRVIDDAVIVELMRHFGVSFSALLYRLASTTVKLLSAQARDVWLQKPVSSVLRAANDPAPEELTTADESRRIPPRLWRTAQAGYQEGRVGIGTLAALADEDAERLFLRLAASDVRPPAPADDLSDL